MTIAHSAGVFLGTDETTGVTIANNASSTSSEIDLLGDDSSTGDLFLYVKFTSTVTAGTVDIVLYRSRISSQAYADDAPICISVAPINGTKRVDVIAQTGQPFRVSRRMTLKATNNATGASATNVTIGYELTKYS